MTNLLILFMLGFRGANSETSKCQPLTLNKSCFYALWADFWFGFCKNTEKLFNFECSDLTLSLVEVVFQLIVMAFGL